VEDRISNTCPPGEGTEEKKSKKANAEMAKSQKKDKSLVKEMNSKKFNALIRQGG